ncbi:MAG: DUF4255 domain-containing protein [Patulibacter minatonensis]
MLTNQVLLDLDDAIGRLLERELAAVGIPSVRVVFEPPTREGTAGWPAPALNVFLYDVREAEFARDRGWHPSTNADGAATLQRGAMRIECSYVITAWTKSIRDEHRLLSQVMAILLAHPVLPAGDVAGDLLLGDPPVPVTTRIARGGPTDRASFWNAISGPFKVSLELGVTAVVQSVQEQLRGPAVTHARVAGRYGTIDEPDDAAGVTQGGTLAFRSGCSTDGAVIVVPAVGLAALVDRIGGFRLRGIPAGTYAAVVREVEGTAHPVQLTVPSARLEITIDD